MLAKECTYCKTSNPISANFCRKCGHRFPEHTKPGKSQMCHIENFSIKKQSNGRILIEWKAINATKVTLNNKDVTGQNKSSINIKGSQFVRLRAENSISHDEKESHIFYDSQTIYKDKIVEKKIRSKTSVFAVILLVLSIFIFLVSLLLSVFMIPSPKQSIDYSDTIQTDNLLKNNYDSIQLEDGNNKLLEEHRNISCEIENITFKQGVYKGDIEGMDVHIKFSVEGMKEIEGICSVYIYYEDGPPLKDTNGSYSTPEGNCAFSKYFTPQYDSSAYNDFVIFIPYNELELPKGIHNMKISCTIWENTDSSPTQITTSDYYYHFTIIKD